MATLKNAYEIQKKLEISHAKKGLAFGVFSGASWGLSGVLLGMVLKLDPFANTLSLYMAPLVGAALHDGFAGFWVLLINILNGKWREYGRTLGTKPGMIVCLAALFGGPIAMSGYLLAINLAGASYALAITSTYPALGAILAVIILKEKISTRIWIGIVICIIGSIIVGYAPPEGGSYPHFYLGLGLAFLAACGWAMEGVLSTYGMDMIDPDISIGIREMTSFIVYLAGVLPLIAGFRMFAEAFTQISIWVIALAGLLGGLSYLAWYRALNMTGVGRAMALNITYSIWAVFFSWILENVEITMNLILGSVIIVSGALLVTGNPKELMNLRNKG